MGASLPLEHYCAGSIEITRSIDVEEHLFVEWSVESGGGGLRDDEMSEEGPHRRPCQSAEGTKCTAQRCHAVGGAKWLPVTGGIDRHKRIGAGWNALREALEEPAGEGHICRDDADDFRCNEVQACSEAGHRSASLG